tara:strand:+ start:285 stop:743 length:459 start_codon:yes stop_codon:yes gene_type:complete
MFSSQDNLFMKEAIDQAKKAFDNNEVPVGAVIVHDNVIVASACNSVIADNDISSHAEINAIRKASQHFKNYRLQGCKLYVTLEPCHMCAKAISDARIDCLIFATKEPKTGSIVSIDNVYDKRLFNHKVKYKFGLKKDESSKLLKDFFKNKRS